MYNKKKIVIADDSAFMVKALEGILGDEYETHCVLDGEKVVDLVRNVKPVLILLDIVMPGKNGFEIIRELKEDEAINSIPVIFLTSLGDEINEEMGFSLGAADYIYKPLKPGIVNARVKKQVESYIVHQKALLNEQCFKVLADQTGKVIFEWDFLDNKIVALSNFETLFGRSPSTRNSVTDALDAKMIHSDDHDAFHYLFDTILSGKNVSELRVRIKDAEDIFHWCSISAIVVNDSNGKPHKAIASLENIDERVEKEEHLRRKAEMDQLTGLFNKITTEYLIKESLKHRCFADDKYALLIIDIDNFKKVNDTLGHLYGDSVLKQLASHLKPLFRKDDIVGRVGGDEFFVFLKNYQSVYFLEKKSEEICRLFHKTFQEGNTSVNVSASIGISLCPENGTVLDELYKAADIALYNAKARGKDQYVIFDGNSPDTYQSSRTEIDAYERGNTGK